MRLKLQIEVIVQFQMCISVSRQFTASSAQEAREWVNYISFVLRGKWAGSIHLSLFTGFFFFFFMLVFWGESGLQMGKK